MDARQARIAVAADTERIIKSGRYDGPAGPVELRTTLDAAVSATVHVLPEHPLPDASNVTKMAITVTAETSLDAARRLVAAAPDPVLCLNFASAVMPGGGYATGAPGQEESLARATGLVACLHAVPAFYEDHRARRDPLYTDQLLLSPGVPVFRDDDGALLERPYPLTILTSPAPNATQLGDPHDPRLPGVFDRRIARVLDVAAAHGYRRLILGAWGCGAFGNDPELVADVFAARLRDEQRFELVVFAIPGSPGSPNLPAFEGRFGDAT